VHVIAFARDATLMATAVDNRIVLWDRRDGMPRRVGEAGGHEGEIDHLAVAPDGMTMVSASDQDGTALIWNVADPANPQVLSKIGGAALSAMALSPDANTLAVANDSGGVTLWDISRRGTPRLLPVALDVGQVAADQNPADFLAFSPDGRFLAVASSDLWPRATATGDGRVEFWDLSDAASPRRLGAPLITRADPVRSVAFSPNGDLLAMGGGKVTFWDVRNAGDAKQIATDTPFQPHDNAVFAMAFSHDGRTLVTGGSDNTTKAWNIDDPANPRAAKIPLAKHRGMVYAVAFSPDGSLLVSGGADSEIMLTDMTRFGQPGLLARPLAAQRSGVSELAFVGASRVIVSSALDDGELLRWNLDNPAAPVPLTSLPNLARANWELAVSPDGRLLATAGDSDQVFLWDLTDDAAPVPLGSIDLDSVLVGSLDFSADGETLAVVNNGTVSLWSTRDPRSPKAVSPPAFAQDASWAGFIHGNDTLATFGDRGMEVWDVTTPDRPSLLTTATDVPGEFTKATDQQLAATHEQDHVVLWDLTDPRQPRRQGQTSSGSTVGPIALTPDGRTLATASSNTVQLWDLSDPERPQRLGQNTDDHPGRVEALSFSADGSILTIGNADGSVFVRDMTTLNTLRADPTPLACVITGGGLSPSDWAASIPEIVYRDTCPG
jgi:WD40 repeat protein